jgi:hypothetical protein
MIILELETNRLASTKIHPHENLMVKFNIPRVGYLLPDHRRD